MPSVLDQPTTLPPVRAMCAISRLVVVLPLVPVTATTGIVGTDRVRGSALGRGGDPLGSAADGGLDLLTRNSVLTRHRVEDVRHGPTHLLGTVAVPPWVRHDDRCGSLVGRTRTASRTVPDSCAIARTRRATARRANL